MFDEKEIEVHITGSGKKYEIIESLNAIISDIENLRDDFEGRAYEDPILCCELTPKEDERN